MHTTYHGLVSTVFNKCTPMVLILGKLTVAINVYLTSYASMPTDSEPQQHPGCLLIPRHVCFSCVPRLPLHKAIFEVTSYACIVGNLFRLRLKKGTVVRCS